MSRINSVPEDKRVDCFECKHFYVTWEPNQPRGCKAFAFKSRELPSLVVFEASGERCLKFTPKRPPKNPTQKRNGWIA